MSRGDIVLAVVPFTDLGATKIRPVVVVSSDEFSRREDRIVVPISSSVSNLSVLDVAANPSDAGFAQTGLHRPSTFKCGNIITLNATLIKRRLGRADSYLPGIEARLRQALSL